MLRFTVTDAAHTPLPPLDLDAARIVLGSSVTAQLRLPAAVARDEHVVIADDRWVALAQLTVSGETRAAGDSGPIGAGVTFTFGSLAVAIAPAPAGSAVSPPQRTESLALELVRGMLGSAAAPTFTVETGPLVGARRALAPPPSTLIVGRGDEAQWVILDEDLSRTHAEIRRGWDGVAIRDLDSKNGTAVDGTAVTDWTPLHHGARVALGKVLVRFDDPAEAHLRGGPAPARPVARELGPVPMSRPAAGRWPMYVAAAIALVAAAGAVWMLA